MPPRGCRLPTPTRIPWGWAGAVNASRQPVGVFSGRMRGRRQSQVGIAPGGRGGPPGAAELAALRNPSSSRGFQKPVVFRTFFVPAQTI